MHRMVLFLVLSLMAFVCSATNPGNPYSSFELNIVKCVDSDGGRNYFVKGQTSYLKKEAQNDVCISPSMLLEGFCSVRAASGVGKDFHYCVNGCFRGACNRGGDVTESVDDQVPEGFADPFDEGVPEGFVEPFSHPVMAGSDSSHVRMMRDPFWEAYMKKERDSEADVIRRIQRQRGEADEGPANDEGSGSEGVVSLGFGEGFYPVRLFSPVWPYNFVF